MQIVDDTHTISGEKGGGGRVNPLTESHGEPHPKLSAFSWAQVDYLRISLVSELR